MALRTLIVDDEPLAREGLRAFLHAEADVEIVGECGSGTDAVSAIESERPDLVLLDVQMPELDGFGVLRAVRGPLPSVVFVTAFDAYAVEAFEAHAVDYLLKPVARARFREALTRVRSQLEIGRDRDAVRRVSDLVSTMSRREAYVRRFTIRTAGRITFVRSEDVDWIEAAGNYARLHAAGERHVIRETMTALERQLDPGRFARIHRSTIVNVDRIREIQPWFKGEHVVILQDGTRLSLSRRYRDRLLS